jgi:hypothetical protein
MGAPIMDVLCPCSGYGIPEVTEMVHPEHDDETVMVGAPIVGPPAVE